MFQNVDDFSQNSTISDITIRRYKHSDSNNLEEYLKEKLESTPFHSLVWSRIIEAEYGHENESLIAINNDKVCGYLPMNLIKIPLSKGILATGLFTSHCEVLSNNKHIEKRILNAAVSLAKHKDVNYLELKNKNKIQNSNLIGKDDYVTMMYDCNFDQEQAWLNFPSYVRKQIKKSKKNGLSAIISKEDLDDFYNLLSATMKRHGTPVHSKSFYKRIINDFEKSTIVKIKSGDKVISAYLLIGFNDKLYSLAGASNTEYWNQRPNELVTWETISYAIENNYKSIDLGRSVVDSGTYYFKKKMGALPNKLNYYYYLNNSNNIPQIDQHNPKLKLATSVWKRIPIDITKKYGHYLIRYVA